MLEGPIVLCFFRDLIVRLVVILLVGGMADIRRINILVFVRVLVILKVKFFVVDV